MFSNRTPAHLALYSGVAMTLIGNGLTAVPDGPISIAIGVSSPLALLLVWEMTARTPAKPSRRRWWHRAQRIVPSLAIMALTAWMSFGHLYALAVAHGQSGWWALLPDALMIVASSVLRDAPAVRKPRQGKPVPVTKSSSKATRSRKPRAAVLAQAATVVDKAAAELPIPVSPAPVSA